MKTTDEVPIDSTRLALPEMPYMSVMKPEPFDGPKLSTADSPMTVASGDYVFLMGAGKPQSGWLTLTDKSVKGYGTTG
jgi:hypothetical protein